jgi:hypothetical protein
VSFGSVRLGALKDSTITFSATNFADGPDTLAVSVAGIHGTDSLSFLFENFVTSLFLTAQGPKTLKLACLPKTTGSLTASAILQTDGQPAYDTIALSANAVSSVSELALSPTGVAVDVQPNPASVVVHLNIRAGTDVQGESYVLHIIDEAGRVLSTFDQHGRFDAVQSVSLQTTTLASGAYTIQIDAGGTVVNQRLIIAR